MINFVDYLDTIQHMNLGEILELKIRGDLYPIDIIVDHSVIAY